MGGSTLVLRQPACIQGREGGGRGGRGVKVMGGNTLGLRPQPQGD